MGKRKQPKDAAAAATATALNDVACATSTDIFKNLFGNVEENAAVSSIFSDSNPFKRKPQEPQPKDNFKALELKQSPTKKKESKETKRASDRGSVEEESESAPLDAQRVKKAKTPDAKSSLEVNAEERPDLGEVDVKKRRKRKRDEVEAEYEAKKYGVVLSDNVENPAAVVVGEKRKKAGDEADALVSNEGEGFDDESKLLRTVFVGNLPLKVKKKAILKEFCRFGEIESVRIRSVPIADTKMPRKAAVILKKVNDAANSVNAYVVFKTEQSAEVSLAHNMAVVGGNHIRVDRACPPRKKLKADEVPHYDTKRTIFVGNLPFDVKDEEIYQLFCGIKELQPSIEAVRVVRDPHIGLGKGVAYVMFKTREAATLAIKKRYLKLRDRELRLSHTKQNSTPSKRKSPFPPGTDKPPSKKFAVEPKATDSSGSGSNRKRSMSYQGLRANKSGGIQKKVHPKHNEAMKMKSKAQKGERREGKRLAVAARKEKAKALKEIGASKQAGKKRKFDSRTPESSKQKKKFKKSS